MKLYVKHLKNIKELENERQILINTKQEILNGDTLIYGSILPILRTIEAKRKKRKEKLILSKQNTNLVSVATITTIKQKKDTQKRSGIIIKNKAKHLFQSIAKEIIGGYLKWKAIELSILLTRNYFLIHNKKGRKTTK